MTPTLQDLPDELLVEVLGYLPKSDLKSARLASTRYGRIGAQWLFQRVYFAPRKSVIEIFLNISANPTFARTVTELVYDGRLFLPELVAYRPYKEAFDANIPHTYIPDRHGVDERDTADADLVGDGSRPTNNADSDGTPLSRSATRRREVYHETLANHLVHYTRLFEQQQCILGDQKDYEALLTGLTNLPHITTVTILDKSFRCSERTLLGIGDHVPFITRPWYEMGMVLPAQWPQNMHREHAVGNKWDVRGVQNLIRAVSVHCRKLTGLDLASVSSSAPITFFEMDEDVYDAACKMAQRLTSLKLNLHISMSDSAEDMQEQYEGLEGFLSQAKELRCLEIMGRLDFKYINHTVWPHLETLNLEHLGLNAAELKVMMQAHKGTLRDLEFCNVYMYGGEGWADAAKEMGKYLRLRRICVSGVCDDVTIETLGQPYLEDEVNLAVARSFMQSIPSTKVMQVDFLSAFIACLEEDSSPVEAVDSPSHSRKDEQEEGEEGKDEDREDEEEEEEKENEEES